MEEHPDYRSDSCGRCGRLRVAWDGICEKCSWHADRHEYVTRPSILDDNSPWPDKEDAKFIEQVDYFMQWLDPRDNQ